MANKRRDKYSINSENLNKLFDVLIVFKNSNITETIVILEKIKNLIKKHTFTYDNDQIKITASFGVSMLNEDNNNMELLIEEADKNLYKAKELGRNLIIG